MFLNETGNKIRRGKGLEKNGPVENLVRKFEAPLAPSLPPLGAGAHTIHLYCREILIRVIQHYRDWGAPAAGRSPWSAIRKEVFYKAEKHSNIKRGEFQ